MMAFLSKFVFLIVLINLVCCQHFQPSSPSTLSSRRKDVSDLLHAQLRKPINLQNSFLARPIKKITRIKLIKMLIKQIRRVARDRSPMSIKSTAHNRTLHQTNVNRTQITKLPASTFDMTDTLNLTDLTSLMNQLQFVSEPSFVPLAGSVPSLSSPLPQPVYTWQPSSVPQVQFWPAIAPSPLPIIRTDGQMMHLQLPLNQLSQLPVFIDQQLRSTAGQQAVQDLLSRQWTQIRRSAVQPEVARGRWKRFVRQVSSVAVEGRSGRTLGNLRDRFVPALSRVDAQLLQEGITRILGGFVGDLVGVVVEEVLQKKGEIIANGIRLIVGDLATFVLSKGNLALELSLKNLSKVLFLRS
jgi:hypothetical protein